MARIRKIEKLVIATQNIIPSLAEIPLNNAVMMLAAGGPAIPISEYIVSGITITWDDVTAGFNLEVGEEVVADYEYDDGTTEDSSAPPYDETDTTMNPVLMNYEMVVAEINIVPNLVHIPVASTFVFKVNGVVKAIEVDWTRVGKVVTWISGSTLNINDIIYVEYRRVA